MSGSSHLDASYPNFQRFARADFAFGRNPQRAKLIPAQMQLKYFLICTFVTGRRGKGS
jgi:hypothetical protein